MKLILAFIALIVGISLIGVIATNSLAVTEKINVLNETVNYTAKMLVGEVNNSGTNNTLTNYPTGWEIADCPLTALTAISANKTPLTLNTDYQVDLTTGVFAVLNTTITNITNNDGSVAYVSYTHCPSDYLNSSWGRSSLNLVAGFFAIGLLLVSVGLFYSVGKDAGFY